MNDRSNLANKTPEEWRAFLNHVGDELVFSEVKKLRDQVESIDNWKATKEKAKSEIQLVAGNILEELLNTFEQFINELPAGHGKGHLYRDIISITSILHDPELRKYDNVELFVGILGGVFHDIGNSVVERYAESRNFSGHAEVGAYLFGIKAKQILPPNLCILTQFVIAAHTHYLNELSITKNKKTLTRQVYEDTIIDGNKVAVLLARQSDRSDILGIPGVIRHSLTKITPTQDLSEGGFQEIHEDELEDFKHQFTPTIRTKEYRDSLPSIQEKSTNVLEHLKMFADSNDGKTPYSRNDSDYVREVILNHEALQQYLFITQDVSLTEKFSNDERNEAFERFFTVCQLFEPSKETNELINLFRKRFQLLSTEQQNHWATAFLLLTTKLFDEWYSGKKKLIESIPLIGDKKLQTIVTNLHSIANTYIEEFNPRLLA